MNGGAVIDVLDISSLAAFSSRTAVKSCTISVYTSYKARYSYLFLLVSDMFGMISVHFGLSPTDAGLQPSYTFHDSIGVTVLLYVVFILQPQRICQVSPDLLKLWGGNIRHGTIYHYYCYNDYIQEPQKSLNLYSPLHFTHTSCTKQEKAVISRRTAHSGNFL
jgi:hypothetical protein